jgi:hypothetical protein
VGNSLAVINDSVAGAPFLFFFIDIEVHINKFMFERIVKEWGEEIE